MHESIFSGKVSLTTPSALITAKVDVVKDETRVDVRLIETSNIFSLFVCSISQSDYYVLKRDQDLLVDYDRFISILVGLFHNLSTGRLSALFSDGKLRFIENGEFRNICKLELKFTKPEEAQYKRYLGDLISRMEGDNIKLIKENKILRDKSINGDRELRDKIRYLESEIQELRRKYETATQNNSALESRDTHRMEEINRLTNRVFSLENENAELNNELEKLRRENIKGIKEQLVQKEMELEEIKKEINTANEIIRKIRNELAELKEYKNKNIAAIKQEEERNEGISNQLAALNKKYKGLEEKYKGVKEDNKIKNTKIKELEMECKTLRRNLDNTRYVNNFLYEQKIGDQLDNYSDSLNIRPEPESPTK